MFKKLCLLALFVLVFSSNCFSFEPNFIQSFCSVYSNSAYFGCLDKKGGLKKGSSLGLLRSLLNKSSNDKKVLENLMKVVKEGYNMGYLNKAGLSCDSISIIAKMICEESLKKSKN